VRNSPNRAIAQSFLAVSSGSIGSVGLRWQGRSSRPCRPNQQRRHHKTGQTRAPRRPESGRPRQSVAVNLRPQIGVMVTQATHAKARSITHCCQMAGSRRMSVERKYDGEYCQIHIDLTKGNDPIRIFPKSGRDSTDDRIGLHGAIRDCLRLRLNDCRIALL